MDIYKLIDNAFEAIKNADKKTTLHPGIPQEILELINPDLSRLNLPPLPADYLYLLGKSCGCWGHYFDLYGIDKIDRANGTIIESAIIDDSQLLNRFEGDDDIPSKGLVVGYMHYRIWIVYRNKQYQLLDNESCLPLLNVYDSIADLITETINTADVNARKAEAEKAQKK